MTYLLHCSFPIHQIFLSDDWHDCYAEPTTPPSRFNPHHFFPQVLFHLRTQRGYAHAKGHKKTHIDFGTRTCLFLEKRERRKTLTWGCLTHPKIFPLTSMRDWECLLKYLSLLHTLFLTHPPHPVSSVHFMLSITYTYPFVLSLFYLFYYFLFLYWFIFSRKSEKKM